MLKEELLRRKTELEKEVANLELKIRPFAEDLNTKREMLQHVVRYIELDEGSADESYTSIAPRLRVVKPLTWARICRRRGWDVGVDSAHRVVRKQDPSLHASIPHDCGYDGREYP